MPVRLSERCCGEAGTLGSARPDIASQLRYRKLEALRQELGDEMGVDKAQVPVRLLTSCPACLQGLAKFTDETGLTADYLVSELARGRLGVDWREQFIAQARAGGIERVLL